MACVIVVQACRVNNLTVPDAKKKYSKRFETLLSVVSSADDQEIVSYNKAYVYGYMDSSIAEDDVLYLSGKLFIENDEVLIEIMQYYKVDVDYEYFVVVPSFVQVFGVVNSDKAVSYSQYSVSKSMMFSSTIACTFPDHKWRARTIPNMSGVVSFNGYLNDARRLAVQEVITAVAVSKIPEANKKANAAKISPHKAFGKLPPVGAPRSESVSNVTTDVTPVSASSSNASSPASKKGRKNTATASLSPISSRKKSKVTVEEDEAEDLISED